MKENDISNIRTSIERLCKVIFYKFENYDPEIAIDTYKDIINIYNKFENKEIKEYILYKLKWIKQHKKIDDYYKNIINELYNQI